MFDGHKSYIAGAKLDRLADDDIFGDTAQFIGLVCYCGIKQVVNRYFECCTGKDALLLPGNTVRPICLTSPSIHIMSATSMM